MKKIQLLVIVHVVLSLLFSLSTISFAFDISIFAFILSIIFVVFLVRMYQVTFMPMFNASKLATVRKLLEYHPFVFLIAFILCRAGEKESLVWIDSISVTLWILSSACSAVLLYVTNPKRIKKLFFTEVFFDKDLIAQYISDYTNTSESLAVKPKGVKRVLFEVLEWVDAFIQAAFLVSLINIFIFQLYEIPSESMVSEFLIGDRVVVIKTPSGPAFPLSHISIPKLRSYKRGDIVVFRNPHYSKDRKSEIKTFVAQLVYMLSFTTVNLNVDEFGMPKYDPLVKRITGLPGEQLMMVDGVLYARTKESAEFVPVIDKWADWNLNTLPVETKKSIASFPFSDEVYTALLSVEDKRKNLDLQRAKTEIESIVQSFERLKRNYAAKQNTTEQNPLLDVSINRFFAKQDDVIRTLLSSSNGSQWFSSFVSSWISDAIDDRFVGGDLYQDALFRYNVLAKLTFARLVLYTSELIVQGVSATDMLRDEKKRAFFTEAREIDIGVLFLNSRSIPVFPPNDAEGNPVYIAHEEFFMMGDNRFNSLDMRHSYMERRIPLTSMDPLSFYYNSNVAPQTVESKYILGTTFFRFWPLNRIGVPNSGVNR
ncbi:MAG: signal peptidase I [Treponemataceae bacterium]